MNFFKYNEELLKKVQQGRFGFAYVIIVIVLFTMFIVSLINKDSELTSCSIMLFIFFFVLAAIERFRNSHHSIFFAKKYKEEYERMKISNTLLGAELKDDYIMLRGLIFSYRHHDDATPRIYFTERIIYYKDVKDLSKNKYNIFIDFYDRKYSSTTYERLFLNNFFDNSDLMFYELKKKLELYIKV